MRQFIPLSLAFLLLAGPAAAQLTDAQKAEIEREIETHGPNIDAAMYARDQQVPLTEAIRRMNFQMRDVIRAQEEPGPPPPPPNDSIGAIQRQAGLEPTFAGLWIQHKPTYGVVVAFTRDAEKTLAKYTRDPMFIPLNRPGPTARELGETQDRLFHAFQRLGARPMSASTDIMKGRVEIEVFGEMGRVREAIASGALPIPDYVDIVEPKPLAHPAPPPAPPGFVNPVKAFPRYRHRGGGPTTLELRTGRVILGPDGCLRMQGDRHSPVIVWPNEAALDLSHGDVRVFHRMNGNSISVGETIALGGSSQELKDSADVIDENPACPGPYLYLTGFTSFAPIEAQMLEQRARERAQADIISLDEARKRLRIEAEREARLRAFGERMLNEAPGVYAGMTVWGGKAVLLQVEGAPPLPIPDDLVPYITVQRRPKSLAELNAVRDRLLDQIEAAGLTASAGSDIDAGRVTLQTDDILALSQAAVAGRIAIPDDVQVLTNGATPAGYPGEWNMEAAWRVLESAPDFAEIRSLVDATALPFYGEAPRKPSKASSLDITRYLVMLGFTAKDIRALRAQGVDPVTDWVKQNGFSTLENRAVLAEQVVVGEVVSVDPKGRALNDGYRSTVRLKVVETLKGDAKPGETVTVRLASGYDLDGKVQQENGEPMLLPGLPKSLKPGDRYLLFLSSGQYANLARHSGYKPADPRWYALRQEMARIDGGLVERTYGEPSPGTLDEVRARLRPVQAAFERASL